MAGPGLPVNIDFTYPDTGDASVKIHQQHHDVAHSIANAVDKDLLPVAPVMLAGIVANNQTGTSYTLTLADAGRVIELNNAAAISLFIPTDAAVPFPIGTVIKVWQQGAGQVTVSAVNSGTTTILAPAGGLVTPAQYGTVVLRKRAANQWVVSALVASAATGATGGPSTPPIVLSGADAALLNGPTSAPGGAVTITPGGTKLDAATLAQPAGTTFYLTAGTHTLDPTYFGEVVPKTGNTYIGAPGAILSGAGINAYAFTQNATDVTIKYLTITGFVCPTQQFVVNHDAAASWTIQFCNVYGNGGAAIGVGSNNIIDTCWLHDNEQYGFSAWRTPVNGAAVCAVSNCTINRCEISYNGTLSLEWNPDGTPTGAGLSGAGKFWDTQGMVFTNNYIHHSVNTGLWADTNNVDLTCRGNYFSDNYGPAIAYEISYNFLIENNTIVRNGIYVASRLNNNFPRGAIYISESGGDAAVSALYPTSYIRNNTFIDNWDDITLWESADRFCNSVGNSSPKIYKPKGHGATLAGCNQPTAKVLTVALTSGQPTFTVTSGALEFTDEGRPCSGTGIPAGTNIVEPLDASTPAGVVDAANGRMTANATSSGSFTMTVAAGTVDVDPMFTACRWKTKNVSVSGNTHSHNSAIVVALGWPPGYTLPEGVVTGKISLVSQYGSSPTWSPYQGAIVENQVAVLNNNVWTNNSYTGPYSFQRLDPWTGLITWAQWRAAGQDAGSTLA